MDKFCILEQFHSLVIRVFYARIHLKIARSLFTKSFTVKSQVVKAITPA
jgi:hypothetical protein